MLKTVTTVLLFAGWITGMYWFYGAYVYKADVAKDWLDMAQVSNNLGQIDKDIKQSIAILDNYHGTRYPYPSPNGNYDVVREHLQSIVTVNEAFAAGNTAMSYQQLLQNHNNILKNAIGDLENINVYYVYNPATNYVWLFFIIAPWPILIVEAIYQDYNSEWKKSERQERREQLAR